MHKITSMSLGFSMFSFINASTSHDQATKADSRSKKAQKTNESTAAAESSQSVRNRRLLNAKSHTLKNGLQVIVVEDRAIPRVSVGVLYKVGSCDDPENLFGLSHMTEHMFFHGSVKYPQIDATIGKLGGTLNACTSSDCTAYITDVPATALEVIFRIEANRMGNFNLRKTKIFGSEKKAVHEERLMVIENQPDGVALEYIRMAISPQHPYGREVIGFPHNIMNYSADAVMEHYRKWYAPNNAVLIVVGDVNAADVFKKAEAHFGNIKSRDVPKRVRVANASSDIHQKLTFYSSNVASNKVDLVYNAPHHSTHSMKEIRAMKILLEVLFGGVVYEFCHRFLQKNELVADFCVCHYTTLDPAPFYVCVSLRDGVTCEKFLKEYFKRIKELAKRGVSEEDFRRAKQSYLTSATYQARDGHSRIRMRIVECLGAGGTLDQIENAIVDIESVTIEDVNNMLRQFINKKPFAIIKTVVKPSEAPNET
ncbi:MAG: insulinase family protein [Holosporales bacterium]|nr:insulinase family protein [Holosporales bacterium]